MNNPFNGLVGHWQTLAAQSMDAFNSATTQTARQTAEQFFAGQEQLAHLMRLTLEAWTAFVTNAAAPDQWQQQVEAFSQALRQQLHLALATWQGSQQLTELGQLYTQEWQKFAQPWVNAFGQTPALWTQSANGAHPSAAAGEFANLFWGAFQQTWGQWLAAPSLGLTREFNDQQKQVYALWLDQQRALADYQRLLGDAWIEAFTAYLQKLIGLAQSGKPAESQRQLIDLWVEVADVRFLDLFHSEQYAQVQSRLLKSSMDLRRQQRDLNEVWLRLNDLPTRSDLDEAHHALYELRKEIKVLKKVLQATGQSTVPTPGEPPAKKQRGRRTAIARVQTENE
jgi:polyhydroxyalkanoate synthase subunit PhaE